MMTILMVAKTVMMAFCFVPQPKYMLRRPQPHFSDCDAGGLVQNLTATDKMSGSLLPAILDAVKVFQCEIMRLTRTVRAGTAFAD